MTIRNCFKIEKGFDVKVKHQGDAAIDIPCKNGFTLQAHQTVLVDTPITCLGMPTNMFGLVLSRSGLSLDGVIVANAPGLIDSNYRGKLKVILTNTNHEYKIFKKGDRIAQFMILSSDISMEQMFGSTAKIREEAAGFGSSGV